jgi:hypothetical protein
MNWQNQHSKNITTIFSKIGILLTYHFTNILVKIHHQKQSTLNAIPIKIPMTFITETENSTVKFEAKKTMSSQGNTNQKEKCWRYHNT